MSYQGDREWSDAYIPALRRVVGPIRSTRDTGSTTELEKIRDGLGELVRLRAHPHVFGGEYDAADSAIPDLTRSVAWCMSSSGGATSRRSGPTTRRRAGMYASDHSRSPRLPRPPARLPW